MPTGACGINCDVCRLNLLEICSSCGSGKSREGQAKADVQKRLFGRPCPVLDCAILNRIDFCLKDCQSFPCDNFRSGAYPYGEGYLSMHDRRRKENPPVKVPGGEVVSVPSMFWESLADKPIDLICENSHARKVSGAKLAVRFLSQEIIIDMKEQSLWQETISKREKIDNTLLELMVVVYLNNATAFSICDEMISVSDLKDARFFQGPHELRTGAVLKRYGNDIDGFIESAAFLGGQPIDAGDSGFMLLPFPKIPLYYVLWEGDEEFKPHLSVLFDRSIERHLAADGIWGTVNLVSQALIKGTGWRL